MSLAFPFGFAVVAGTDAAKVFVRIDAAVVIVVPFEPEGVITNRFDIERLNLLNDCSGKNVEWIHRRTVLLRLIFTPFHLAGSAGTFLPENLQRVNARVIVVPGNFQIFADVQLDVCRFKSGH